MEAKENYYCINCGSSLKFLFKEYSPSVLKLQECVSLIYLFYTIHSL